VVTAGKKQPPRVVLGSPIVEGEQPDEFYHDIEEEEGEDLVEVEKVGGRGYQTSSLS